jgi:DNA-binding NarL/FixJ family response regulator
MSTPATILIIDDDPNLLRSLEVLFSRKSHTVLTARNGADGWQRICQNMPDLVLCDVLLPSPDGFELLRRVNADPRLQCLPFIFLTAYGAYEDELAAFEIGAADYITKPFNPDLLLARVESLLRRVGIHKKTGSHFTQLEPGTRDPGCECPQPDPEAPNDVYPHQETAKPVLRHASLKPSMSSQLNNLSERETEVLGLIAEGKTNAEIASLCSISEATVRSHTSHIRSKLKLENKVQLIVYTVVGSAINS